MGLIAGVFASVAILMNPSPAAAECSFIPPLPKITPAVYSARELFVGEVIAIGDYRGDLTVRVDEVLRGPAFVGEVRHLVDVDTNWPWSKSSGLDPYPACIGLWGDVGETVAIALDARWPGGTIRENHQVWYQPPTRYNTMAIIHGLRKEPYSGGRQRMSVERLREMVAGLPATDMAPESTGDTQSDGRVIWVLLAGVVGALAGARQVRRESTRLG
jgi:hypothetical protein